MSIEGIPDDVVLPCGCSLHCTIVDGVNTLTAVVCHDDCTNIRNLVDLAIEEDLPVEVRDLND